MSEFYRFSGKRLRAARLAHGLGTRELAERAQIGHATVKRLEINQHDPHFGVVARLALALDLSILDLAEPADAEADR